MRWTAVSSCTAIAVCTLFSVAGCSVAKAPAPSAGSLPNQVAPVLPLNIAETGAHASPDLRVMSFNVRVRTMFDGLNHWNFRRDQLVETIRRFNPDLLSTQECLAQQADYLRQQLPEYQFIGAGRNDGRRRGEMCGVFYRTSKFTALDHGHFWLSKKPTKPGSKSWGSFFPRMVTWVKFQPASGGEPFVLFNTHFDHSSKRARAESAKLLRRQMQAIAGGLPVIVTGDFNTDEGTAPYQTLVSAVARVGPALADTFRLIDPQRDPADEGTRHGFDGNKWGPRIDWILASKGDFKTLDADIVHDRDGGRYPSDHFPVTAVLRPINMPAMANIE